MDDAYVAKLLRRALGILKEIYLLEKKGDVTLPEYMEVDILHATNAIEDWMATPKKDEPHSIPEPHFDGATYEPELDHPRLTKQIKRVVDVMKGGTWYTLVQVSRLAAAPEASVSARMRDLRKWKFGRHKVHRRRMEGDKRGLFQYSLHHRKCKCELCKP